MNAPGRAAPDPHARRRGAVLVMVLVLGLVGSSLAVVALRASAAGARAASIYLDEVRAEELGQAATDLVAVRMLQPDPQARRAGAFAVRFADALVEVDYVAETARIDLSAASPELLAALIESAGEAPSTARLVADRFVDWRDPDQVRRPSGAEAEDYARAGRSGPADRPFGHVAELDRVLGVPSGLAARLAPALTVASGEAGVDPTIAGRPVIRALMGGDDRRVEAFVARREAGFRRRDELLSFFPSAARGFVAAGPGRAVRADIRVTVRDRFRRRYEAVLTASGDGGMDARVVSWQSYR